MFADGRRCPACGELFMPPHGVPEDNPVQCPHCGSIQALGNCVAVPLDWSPVQRGIVEEDPAGARRVARDILERRFRNAFLVFCAVAVCGAGMIGWRQWGEGKPPPGSLREPVNFAEDAEAGMRVLRAAAAASSPEDLRPWILHPDRVIPLVLELSERETGGLSPDIPVGKPVEWEITGAPGFRVMRARVNVADGGTRKARWEEAREGWRVDWEGYTRIRSRRWNWFLRQTTGVTMELRLRVERSPAPAEIYAAAGASADTHLACAFFPAESERKALAFLPLGGAAARELADLGWEDRLAVTVEVSLVSPETEPPVVEIRALTPGWR